MFGMHERGAQHDKHIQHPTLAPQPKAKVTSFLGHSSSLLQVSPAAALTMPYPSSVLKGADRIRSCHSSD